MNSNITKTVLGGLLPFITNPATLAIIGIGAVGLTVYDILTDKKDGQGNGSKPQSNGSEPLIEPFADGSATVAATVSKPLKSTNSAVPATVSPMAKDPLSAQSYECEEMGPEVTNPDADKRELIRKAMSELGKRSAISRARKKTGN